MEKEKNKVSLSKAWLGFFVLMLALFAIAGWVMNFMTLVHQAFGDMTINMAQLTLRVIGLFVIPLGSILGFI